MKIIPLPAETSAILGWTHKMIVTYADFAGVAATSKTLTIFPDGTSDAGFSDATLAQLPAGFTVEKTQFRLVTPFAGPLITAGTLTIGDLASANRYMASTATDLVTAAATNTKDNVASATTYAFAGADVANNNANLTCTVAVTGANLSTLTAGAFEILMALGDPNELATTTGT